MKNKVTVQYDGIEFEVLMSEDYIDIRHEGVSLYNILDRDVIRDIEESAQQKIHDYKYYKEVGDAA